MTRALRAALLFAVGLFALCALAATGLSCDGGRTRSGGKVRVMVSLAPLEQVVRRIGGEAVEMDVLVPPGRSPHDYSPTLKQMVWLEKADLFVAVGVPYEAAFRERMASTLPSIRIVRCDAGIDRIEMSEDHGRGHDHDDGHDHDELEGELDPHVWMSPRLMRDAIAPNIAEALCEVRPEEAERFRANLKAFQKELDALDGRLSERLAPLAGTTLYVYHPAFGYFARDYGLRQVAVETGGKAPSMRRLDALIEKARDEGVRVLFVQPQFPDSGARALAERIGAAVAPLDPLDPDYMGNLERIARALESAGRANGHSEE